VLVRQLFMTYGHVQCRRGCYELKFEDFRCCCTVYGLPELSLLQNAITVSLLNCCMLQVHGVLSSFSQSGTVCADIEPQLAPFLHVYASPRLSPPRSLSPKLAASPQYNDLTSAAALRISPSKEAYPIISNSSLNSKPSQSQLRLFNRQELSRIASPCRPKSRPRLRRRPSKNAIL
jgi:hypothetical protein